MHKYFQITYFFDDQIEPSTEYMVIAANSATEAEQQANDIAEKVFDRNNPQWVETTEYLEDPNMYLIDSLNYPNVWQ